MRFHPSDSESLQPVWQLCPVHPGWHRPEQVPSSLSQTCWQLQSTHPIPNVPDEHSEIKEIKSFTLCSPPVLQVGVQVINSLWQFLMTCYYPNNSITNVILYLLDNFVLSTQDDIHQDSVQCCYTSQNNDRDLDKILRTTLPCTDHWGTLQSVCHIACDSCKGSDMYLQTTPPDRHPNSVQW